MAYVNMTVDGQANKTSQLNLVGSDGTTKTATLTAVIEPSDIQGGTSQVGEYTKHKTVNFTVPTSNNGSETGRQRIEYDFGADGTPDLILFSSGTSDAGYIKDGIFDKEKAMGVASGINRSNNTFSKTAFSYGELGGNPGNASAGYSATVVKIGQCSANVQYRDSDTYVADCYWK